MFGKDFYSVLGWTVSLQLGLWRKMGISWKALFIFMTLMHVVNSGSELPDITIEATGEHLP